MSENKAKLWANVHQASQIYFLPNLFTAGNLFFGFLSIIFCIRAKFEAGSAVAPSVEKLASFLCPNLSADSDPASSYYAIAILCILVSFFCDALDGRVARATGKSSLFGKEFDSIADSLSFGLAPALLMYFQVLQPSPYLDGAYAGILRNSGLIIGFLFLLCACIRLSRFNVLTNPYIMGHEKYEKGDFCGLPAPAAAGTVASISLMMLTMDFKNFSILLLPLMLLIAWFMISNIPYPSFKHINWSTKTKFRTFVMLILGTLLIFWVKEYSFAIMFLAYVFYAPIKYSPRFYKVISYKLKTIGKKKTP